MTALLCLLVPLLIVGVVLAGVWLLLPLVGEALTRVRIEREAAEASWRIHQQATRAFGEMLEAARQDPRGERQ